MVLSPAPNKQRGTPPVCPDNHKQLYAFMDTRRLEDQNTGKLPLMVSEGLESLMTMPHLKKKFWRRWIQWAGN